MNFGVFGEVGEVARCDLLLPRDAMLARVLAMTLCPCLCLSVASWCLIKGMNGPLCFFAYSDLSVAINTSNAIRTQTGAAERHSSGQDSNSCYYVFNDSVQLYKPIRYDKRCYFKERSKADESFGIQHGTNN